jgi:integrase
MKDRGFGSLWKNCRGIWMFGYYVNGRAVRESCGTVHGDEADTYRWRRWKELTPFPSHLRRSDVPFRELLDMVVRDFRGKSRENMKHKVARIRGALGELPLNEITVERLTAFAKEREEQGYGAHCIAEDLRLAKAALVIARKAGLIGDMIDVVIDWQRTRRSQRSELLAAQREQRLLLNPPKPRKVKAEPVIPPMPQEVRTVQDLIDLTVRSVAEKGGRVHVPIQHGRRFVAFFNGTPPAEIKAYQVEAYKAMRMEAGAQPATVRNELSVLRRGYNLAIRFELLSRKPAIVPPPGDNVRQGFLQPEELFKLLRTLEVLDEDIRDVVEFLGRTGWRMREVTGLRWEEIDLKAGLMTLPAKRSKNGQARPVTIPPAVRAILERRLEKRNGPYVFHRTHRGRGIRRRGAMIQSFYHTWKKACAAIGKAELLVHDLRRGYARMTMLAGVPQAVAMKTAGWLTPSMFLRYNIVDEVAMRAGQDKLEAFMAQADGSAAGR